MLSRWLVPVRWTSSNCAGVVSAANANRLTYVLKPELKTKFDENAVKTLSADRLSPAASLVSWDRKQPVRLRMEDTAPGNYPPILVHTMFRNSVERLPNRDALCVKRDNVWLKWDFTRYYEETRAVAKAFLALGLGPKDTVAIMGSNSPEWLMSSVGAIVAGGLSCGLYTTSTSDSVSTLCKHASFRILAVENAQTLDGILAGRSLAEALPTVTKVVLMEGGRATGHRHDDVITWQELIAIGRAETDIGLDASLREQAVNEACMLVYTSGTTGKPKGVLLSQDNVTFSARMCHELPGVTPGEDVMLSFLPLSHVAGLMVDCYCNISCNCTTYFADKNALKGTLVDNLREVRPTRLLAVPRVYEKIEERMKALGAQSSNPLRKALVDWAKSVAADRHDAIMRGEIAVTDKSLSYRIAHSLIFKRIHKALGLDRVVQLSTGAAPISVDTLNYFKSLDMLLLEVFGSSEVSGPHCSNMPGLRTRIGSVGPNSGGIHNAILDANEQGHGEVVTSARSVFMGYLDDRERTLAAFATDDFWFRTGDLGHFDSDGFLVLSGRLKELIITAGGKNVAPVPIEDAIKKELFDVVSYVVVVGDRRPFLSCLLTLRVVPDLNLQPTNQLDPTVIAWAKRTLPREDLSSMTTVADFLTGPQSAKLSEAVHEAIDRANEKAESAAHRVKKFSFLPMELALATGELTPTLKVKRFVVQDKFSKVIEAMYMRNENQTIDNTTQPAVKTAQFDYQVL